MNFNKKFKLWAACGDARADHEYVYFVNGCAYATDAFLLVCIPLNILASFSDEEKDMLNGFRIHGSLMKILQTLDAATIASGTETDEKGVVVNIVVISAKVGDNEVRFVLRDTGFKTPDFDSVLANDEENAKPVTAVGIGVDSLKTIASAMGQDSLMMRFARAGNKTFIKPTDETYAGMVGVVITTCEEATIPGFGSDDGGDQKLLGSGDGAPLLEATADVEEVEAEEA